MTLSIIPLVAALYSVTSVDKRTAKMFIMIWTCLTLLTISLCTERSNVLFLMMDDLRPNIQALKDDPADGFIAPYMHTPNLDALASKSLVLNQAYVQQAICAPSRTSILTGRRPDTTKVYGFNKYWRNYSGNFTTIPQYFKENGYTSIGIGKIFHKGHSSHNNDPISWSVPYFEGEFNFEDKNRSWEAIPDEHLEGKPLVDQQIADRAIRTLQELALDTETQDHKPFFLAVGFHKPHLPFVFPESILQKYPLENIRMPLNPKIPTDMPDIALPKNQIYALYKDLQWHHYDRTINGSIPELLVRDLRRAYYCAITWADEQLGKVLNELEQLQLIDNTIIVFLSDHGYHLGEHNHWTKFTDFEVALRAPMMMHIPGKTTENIKSDQLVEFVDLFPTLVEAAGLEPLPVCSEDSSATLLCSEGTSFYSMISEPNLPIKKAAFSQARRKGVMGYSIRTLRYRYTEWVKFDEVPFWEEVVATELYDHEGDPAEDRNVVDKEEYRDIVPTLHAVLREGWRKSVYGHNLMNK